MCNCEQCNTPENADPLDYVKSLEAREGRWVLNKYNGSVNKVDGKIWQIKTVKQMCEVACIAERVIIRETKKELEDIRTKYLEGIELV